MKAETLHKAIINHYLAKKTEAIAMLELLYNKSVAISDHTNILDEIKKWVEELEKAESCLHTLNNIVSRKEQPPVEE